MEIQNKSQRFLGAEFSAGVHYARRNNVPLYFVDEVTSEHLTEINLNDAHNYELMRNRSYEVKGIDGPESWSRRNKFMAKAINKHFKNYNNIVHIGGKGHYDSQRCIPLQDLVDVNSKTFIDVNLKEIC